MDNIEIADGFPCQIFHLIPRPILIRAARHPLVQPLYITDLGWFPRARHHYCARPHGAEEHILIFCVRGSGWLEVGEEHVTVHARQALFIPRGTPHSYGADKKTPWSIHWAHFLGDDADYYIRRLPRDTFRLPVSPACATALEKTFRDAYRAIAAGYIGQHITYLSHVLRHLLGLLFYHNRAYSPDRRAPATRDLRPTLDHLREHYAMALTLPDLARQAGLSVTHFATLFRQQTGMAPMKYLAHVRIRHACQLLDNTALTIREIAARTGHEDPYYFSRLFRKIMGLPPRHYRQMRKG